MSSSLTPAVRAAFHHCRDVVRASDWESFMASLFLPPFAMHASWALRAFNVEVATVRDHIRGGGSGAGTLPGKMRMQFWRDGVAELYKVGFCVVLMGGLRSELTLCDGQGRVGEHPVLVALAATLERAELSQTWFRKIINERVGSLPSSLTGHNATLTIQIPMTFPLSTRIKQEADLEDQQPHTLADLEQYGEHTSSSLLYLHLESLSLRDARLDHIASHVGKAQTLATILRATPHNARHRRMGLPAEVMARHRVATEDVFRSDAGTSQAFCDAVFDVATAAHHHLSTARAHMRDLAAAPPAAAGDAQWEAGMGCGSDAFKRSGRLDERTRKLVLAAMLPAVPTDLFLKRLERARFNVFHPKVAGRDWRVPVMLCTLPTAVPQPPAPSPPLLPLLDRASTVLDSSSPDPATLGSLAEAALDAMASTPFGVLEPEQVWTLYRLLLEMPGERTGLTEKHYEALLRHLLGAYVDAPPPPDPTTAPTPPRRHPIPPRALEIATTLLTDMSYMGLAPTGETHSYALLLASTTSPLTVLTLYGTTPPGLRLESWAYPLVLRSLASANRAHRAGAADKVPTHARAPTTTAAPSVAVTKSKVWEVYRAAVTSRRVWLGTLEALLEAFLSFAPDLDLKAVNKARAKVLAAKAGWRRETFGVLMEWAAEVGGEEHLNKYMEKMRARKLRPTRAVHNAILKFWSLRNNPTAVLSTYHRLTRSRRPGATKPPSADDTTYRRVLEAFYSLRQQADDTPAGYTEALRARLVNDVATRVEAPMRVQLGEEGGEGRWGCKR
ncbi:hypothetical protein HDU96_011046, partial [Phlyctochytrium bullatum]